ncbi:conserved hypothetical protein [Ricinus communis]|uniref:Uncharacterized protein n=1 Tax=Ricinus communis TaxID=3988 RepID=B9SZ99_RICCO|nr:conserved hypothetical protein [Ricinus communis]
MQIILKNCQNTSAFEDVEYFKLLLASSNFKEKKGLAEEGNVKILAKGKVLGQQHEQPKERSEFI